MALDDALKRALATPQSRPIVLKIEKQLLEFLDLHQNAGSTPSAPLAHQPKPASLTLDSMNSFNRLLTHRIAEYYGLDHVVVDGHAVKIFYREKRPKVVALVDVDVSGVDPEGPRGGRYHNSNGNANGINGSFQADASSTASSSVSSLVNNFSALSLEPDQALKSALTSISSRNHVLKVEQSILSLVSNTENPPDQVTVEGLTPFYRLLIYKLVQYYNFNYDVDEKTHQITIYKPTAPPQLPRPMETFLQQPREGDWPAITLRDGVVLCGLLRKSLMEPKSRMLILRVEGDILSYLAAVAVSGGVPKPDSSDQPTKPKIPTGPASGPNSISRDVSSATTGAPPLLLAGLNSFNRLLAHNVAVYYGLAHTTTSQEVIVIEIDAGREPRRVIPLGSIPMEELGWSGASVPGGPANGGPPLRLMRRNSPRSSPAAEDCAGASTTSLAGSTSSSTSLEEREQAYQKARERIFKDVGDDDDEVSDDENKSNDSKKGGRGTPRGGAPATATRGYGFRYTNGLPPHGAVVNNTTNTTTNTNNGMVPWMMYPPPHGMPPMMPHPMAGHPLPPMMHPQPMHPPQHMPPQPMHQPMPPMMPPPPPEFYGYPAYGACYSSMAYSPMPSPGPEECETVQNGESK